MSLKLFYALLMVLFFTALPVFAQDQPPGGEHQRPSADDMVAKMQSQLNLTQDQAAAIKPIIEKFSSKREELRQSMQNELADRDSQRSQMKQLKADEKQELAQVLSTDQLSQWDRMQGRAKHKHSDDGGGNDGGPSGPGE